jgi:glucose-6-phosphate 1-dehydrogenase
VQVSQLLKKHNYSKDKPTRIVIEKPFGKDTDTCTDMMGKIMADWKEQEVSRRPHMTQAPRTSLPCWSSFQIYRIDHFLGDDTCRLILQLRFANTWVDSLLNAKHVAKISVIMSEVSESHQVRMARPSADPDLCRPQTFGAEGRGGYFDEFGMIRDVCQNREPDVTPELNFPRS